MSRRKKLILSIIAGICAFLIIFNLCFGLIQLLKNRITFTIEDTLPDGEDKKATVILLAGQSNASGCSSDEYLQKKISDEKYAEYKNGYDNVYINYFVSGYNESKGFVKCATQQGELGGYFGPELGMAEKLHETYPDELFFIVKYAWGDTNLFEQWLSPSSKGETGQLYKAFVAYVETSIKYLVSKNYDVEIKGMCWMQGESDSFSEENATNYAVHLDNFINDLRKKFIKHTADEGMIFVDAYIANNPIYWVYCDLVNQSKKTVSELSDINLLVDTIAEGLSCGEEPEPTPDLAHYDSLSEIKLGHLFIEQLESFLTIDPLFSIKE